MLEKDAKFPNPIAILQIEALKGKNKNLGRMWIYHYAGRAGQSVQTWSWGAVNVSSGDWGSWIWVKNIYTGLIFVELTSDDSGGVVGSLFKDSWQNGTIPPRDPAFYQMPVNGVNWQGQADDGSLEIMLANGRTLDANWYGI